VVEGGFKTGQCHGVTVWRRVDRSRKRGNIDPGIFLKPKKADLMTEVPMLQWLSNSWFAPAGRKEFGSQFVQPSLQNGTVPPSTRRTAGYNRGPIAKLIGMGELVRNQNPPLQKTNVKNARWFIRPYVDRLQPDGSVKRERERIYLGSSTDVDRKSAGVHEPKFYGASTTDLTFSRAR
jgi:hypothetical protein